MTIALSADLIDEVRILAERMGIGAEGLRVLISQNNKTGDTDGRRILIISAADGALDLLIRRWLGEEPADALTRAGGTPTILGQKLNAMTDRSTLIRWPIVETSNFDGVEGEVVALQVATQLSGTRQAELCSSGTWSGAIVVTRASQPLIQREREVLQALSGIVPSVAVLLVAVPGELRGPDDAAQIVEYVSAQVKSNGFGGRRFSGAWLWWIDGSRHNLAFEVGSPGEVLEREDLSSDQAREALVHAGVAQLLRKIKIAADSEVATALPSLDEEELKKLDADFRSRLERLKEIADERFQQPGSITDAEVRGFVKNELLGWDSSKNVYAGPWLEYVETVRPGAKHGLFNQLDETLVTLTAKNPPVPSPDLAQSSSLLSLMATRGLNNATARNSLVFAGAIGLGLIAWYITRLAGYSDAACALAAAGGTLATFSFLKPLVMTLASPSDSTHRKDAHLSGTSGVPAVQRIENFHIFSHQLRQWLNRHVRADNAQVAARCEHLLKLVDHE